MNNLFSKHVNLSQSFCGMTKNSNRLKSIKLWVFYLYMFNYKLNMLEWLWNCCCKFCNWNYKVNRFNRFNLNVVNYLIQVGFRFFLNVALRGCCIKLFSSLPPISFEQVRSPFSSKSLTNDPKVVLNFFLGGGVASSRLNLSFGVDGFIRVCNQWH